MFNLKIDTKYLIFGFLSITLVAYIGYLKYSIDSLERTEVANKKEISIQKTKIEVVTDDLKIEKEERTYDDIIKDEPFIDETELNISVGKHTMTL